MMRPLYGDAADIQRRQEEKERLARQSAEFLGPLSPSDAEQLMELRKLLTVAVTWFEWWVERTGASEPPLQSVEVLRRLRAALNPDLQKETQ